MLLGMDLFLRVTWVVLGFLSKFSYGIKEHSRKQKSTLLKRRRSIKYSVGTFALLVATPATSEKPLYTYMVREALANVFFLETPDQRSTAITLAAISQILASRSPVSQIPDSRIPWAAAVPKTRLSEASSKLYPDDAADQPMGQRSLAELAKSCHTYDERKDTQTQMYFVCGLLREP